MIKRPRVIVVDDSAFARTVLARVLRADGTIDVIGTARDGNEALDRIAALDPDLITLDLTMPELDGLGVLRRLHGRSRPRVIVVSVSSSETELGAEALMLGAIDVIAKPTAIASERLHEIGGELVARIRAVSLGEPGAGTEEPAATPRLFPRAELVMVGASTGGPQALTRLIARLPATLAAPVAVVLHIPIGYTEALAARLDQASSLHVIEAVDGAPLEAGMVVLARAGVHLHVERGAGGLRTRLRARPSGSFMPSVDELFASGAAAVGSGALGVVLTGMGEDGLAGARAIAKARGALITEAAASCVVYGMPRAVFEAGLGARALPLDQIAGEIVKRV